MAGGYRSPLAFWVGGASAPPATTQAGVRSLVAPWMGGASAPTAPATQAGLRSLLAFWLGGAAAQVSEPPAPPADSGGRFGFSRPRHRRLDAEALPPADLPGRDFEAEAAQALARDIASARAIVRQLEARKPQQQAGNALRQAIKAAEVSARREAAATPPAADSARALAAAKAEALERTRKNRNRLRAAMLAALLLMQ